MSSVVGAEVGDEVRVGVWVRVEVRVRVRVRMRLAAQHLTNEDLGISGPQVSYLTTKNFPLLSFDLIISNVLM